MIIIDNWEMFSDMWGYKLTTNEWYFLGGPKFGFSVPQGYNTSSFPVSRIFTTLASVGDDGFFMYGGQGYYKSPPTIASLSKSL